MNTIDAEKLHYRELNEEVRRYAEEGGERIVIENVCGQRFIGAGLQTQVCLEVSGVAGNDLGAFMGAGEIVVRGDAQDGCGNTMNGGRIVVHGNAGDIVGHSMLGGEIYVKGNVGYRVGIHMKAYRDHFPVIVVGGSSGAFLGEYQAGGLIIVLGLAGTLFLDPFYIGTGMHGGRIILRGSVRPDQTGVEVSVKDLDNEDRQLLEKYVRNFCEFFGESPDAVLKSEFHTIAPHTHRPYGKIYAY